VTQDTRNSLGLTDRTGFWLAMAAVLAALGSVAIVIATTEYHKPWTSAWFITGAVACGLGCVSALWALVLYVAHGLAEDHWCPNPQAHIYIERSLGAAMGSGNHAELVGCCFQCCGR
jgi:MFS family permease